MGQGKEGNGFLDPLSKVLVLKGVEGISAAP
jgi:hypothetical protein